MNFLFTHIEPWIWLAGLLLFLTVYAVATVMIVNKKKKTASARQLTTLYMALKTARLLVFLGIIFTYLLVVKIEFKRFALTAIVLYLIYLLLDTLFLSFIEKRLKKK
jgi:cell division protein FtsW (lipid II flippase)